MNKTFYKHYVFLEEINDLLERNLVKLNNVNIIIDINQGDKESLKKQHSIIKFAKRKKIPFLLKNNFQKSIKYNAHGIFLDSKNKKIIKPLLLKKDFKIIGSVHNQLEYAKKIKQGCKLIMLSPLFYNKKYSKYKILGVLKFNIISLNWKLTLCALGGVNIKTLGKINLTRVKALAFRKFIYQL